MRWCQYQAISQRFGDLARDFNSEQMAYHDKCKQRIHRQLKIMGHASTDDEVEKMLARVGQTLTIAQCLCFFCIWQLI